MDLAMYVSGRGHSLVQMQHCAQARSMAHLTSESPLQAKGSVNGFGGEFTVPSYRGATFLDPKGRGGATGYDNAVALPARADSEELAKENTKSTVALKGTSLGRVTSLGCQVFASLTSVQRQHTATEYATVSLAHPVLHSGRTGKTSRRATYAGAGVWSVARVNEDSGEVAGVFETIQPSDTDLGSKEPKEVKISGIWYGQITKA